MATEHTQNNVQQCKYMMTLWMEEPVVQSIQITALSVASGALLIEDDTNEINDELICHIHHREKPSYVCMWVCLSVSILKAVQANLIEQNTIVRSWV